MPAAEPIRTAVVGSGYMGGGIAQVLALAGHHVSLGDVDQATARAARRRLTEQAARFEDEGLFPGGAASTIETNLAAADSIEEAVEDASFVAEAVPEVRELKLEVLRRVSGRAAGEAVIGTNTSAIPIGELAQAVDRPGRFLGVHWMNPAPFVPCVELIPGAQTSDGVVDRCEALLLEAGKTPVRVADTAGFVANRLQFALYREAVQMVQEGVAAPSQIDAVVSGSFGFRLAFFGPFAIGDMAGLDVYAAAYRTLEEAFGDRFAIPGLLAETVAAGDVGLKSGRGFLDVDQDQRAALLAYRDRAYARLSQLRAELGPAPGLAG